MNEPSHWRSLRPLLLLALLLLTVPTWANASDAAAASSSQSPQAPVETLHESLLGVMKDAETLGYQGRFDRLSKVLPNVMDLAFMAQKSVGRYWKTADDAERARLVEAFTKYTTANYAGNFTGFTGETFETQGEEESAHDTRLVRTRLVEPDGEATQLNYRVRQIDGQWKIIDIYLNGTVSELALRRSEYSALIKREGFDSLLVALNEKVSDLADAAPAAQGP